MTIKRRKRIAGSIARETLHTERLIFLLETTFQIPATLIINPPAPFLIFHERKTTRRRPGYVMIMPCHRTHQPMTLSTVLFINITKTALNMIDAVGIDAQLTANSR